MLNDPDKRRAALLSVTLHLALLLLIVLLMKVPQAQKLDDYLVIEIGTPAQSETTTLAPAAEAPAASAPTPQVASQDIGEPQARAAPRLEPQAPEPQQATIQPPAAEAPPQPTATTPTPEPAPREETTTRPPVPAPRTPAAAEAAPSLPSAEAAATALPTIDPVVLKPRDVAPSITIPAPQAAAVVPEARTLAATPQANVAVARAVATPEAQATATGARSLSPVAAEVATAAAVNLTDPTAQAEVAPSVNLNAVQAEADVPAARTLEGPDVQAQVSAARSLDRPAAQASVAGTRSLAPPRVTAVAGVARSAVVTPQIAVTAGRPIAAPSVRAEVVAAVPAAGAPASTSSNPGISDVATAQVGQRSPGGNAPNAGQTGPSTGDATGRGLATSPDGQGAGTGAPRTNPMPYREERDRPVAVLVDNFAGYPQTGFTDASSIIEMPVEGGITRLMMVFDRTDPSRVGPVRSARDYFVELAQDMNAVLVHDGGSPGAMAAIQRSDLPTLNAYNNGALFSRAPGRDAPFNLFSAGLKLRQAVNRLLPARTRVLSGSLFRPAADDDVVTSIRVPYGSDYVSGFQYQSELDSYRWVRNDTPAVDGNGEQVVVDTVLVGDIVARRLPDDPAGRLYVPLDGGPATLYLRGRAVRGHWEADKGIGIRFATEAGEKVDLDPFRSWIFLTPSYPDRVER